MPKKVTHTPNVSAKTGGHSRNQQIPKKNPKKDQNFVIPSALFLKIRDGKLSVQVGFSNGSFVISPELLLLLLEISSFHQSSGSGPLSWSQKLKASTQAMLKSLPTDGEIDSLLEEMREAGVLHSPTAHSKTTQMDGFADPWIQAAMLADHKRCEAYEQAMKSFVSKGSHVLDLGCGNGILSFLALRLGAGKVTAVEETPSIQFAKSLLAPQVLKKQIEFINSNSGDLVWNPSVSHVVSELFGNDPFQEGILPTLRELAGKIPKSLHQKVRFLPESLEVFVSIGNLNSGPYLRRLQYALGSRSSAFQNNKTNTHSDLYSELYREEFWKQFLGEAISFPAALQSSDLTFWSQHSVFKMPLNPFKLGGSFPPKSIQIPIPHEPKTLVVYLSFRVWLDSQITFSTIPGAEDWADHWSVIVIPLKSAVAKGDLLNVTCSLNDTETGINVVVKNENKVIGERIT